MRLFHESKRQNINRDANLTVRHQIRVHCPVHALLSLAAESYVSLKHEHGYVNPARLTERGLFKLSTKLTVDNPGLDSSAQPLGYDLTMNHQKAARTRGTQYSSIICSSSIPAQGDLLCLPHKTHFAHG